MDFTTTITKQTFFKKTTFLSLMIILNLIIFRPIQGQDKKELIKRAPLQVTFLYPLGSNGIHSGYVANDFSLNILAGVSGGVNGLEIGGLANFSSGGINGLQLGGLLNYSSFGDMNGVQVGGLVNFNMDHVDGVQIAGLVNTTLGTVRGLQVAGLVNAPAKDVDGIQIAGIANTALGNVNGLQLGLVNVARKRITGSQVGLVNYTGNLNGFQLGLINIADSVGMGGGLGLINYYKDGYHKLEIETNETFYANLTFKSGVDKFYLLYRLSFKTEGNKSYWAPGVGFGSYFRLSDRLGFNTDLFTSQVNEDVWWTNKLNLLNTAKLNFSLNLGQRFAIFGGPSFNVIVSGIRDKEGRLIGDSFSDHDFYDRIGSHNRVKMFVGVNGGIRF